jgi:hypothetical protein
MRIFVLAIFSLLFCFKSFSQVKPADLPKIDGDFTVVNVDPANISVITGSAAAIGLNVKAGKNNMPVIAGSVLLWEGAGFNDDNAKKLEEYVRNGGSLLLTMGENGGDKPMRIANILPTIGWNRSKRGVMNLSEWDDTFFTDVVKNLTVPWYYEIRPFHAAERGQARYDQYERFIPYLSYSSPDMTTPKLPAGAEWWSRPLQNREWKIRARGNDAGQSPLLITSRYGHGRVAVFASSATTTGNSPAAQAFWTTILRYLATPLPVASALPIEVDDMLPPVVTTDIATRTMKVTLKNPIEKPLTLQLMVRLMSWENAIVGDLSKIVTLGPGEIKTVDFAIPAPSQTGYQELEARDAYNVRLGILSEDGGTLVKERKYPIDMRPPVKLTVATEEVRSIPYPFKAPVIGKEARLGLPIMGYDYMPGQVVKATVSISNGLRNIAKLAKVEDESDPKNPTVIALTDEGVLGEKGIDWYASAYGNFNGQDKKDTVITFTFPQAVTIGAVTLVGTPDTYRNYNRHNPAKVIISVDAVEEARADDAGDRFMKEGGLLRLPIEQAKGNIVTITMPWVKDKSQGAPWLGEVMIDGNTGTLPLATTGTVTLTLRNSLTGETTPVDTREITAKPGEQANFTVPITIPPGGDTARFYRLEGTFAGQQSNVPIMVINPKAPLKPLTELKPPTAVDMGFIVTRGFRNVFATGTGTAEINAGWGQPDDLIWAYSRQLKQIGERSHTQAAKLYVTENDMRHYSTPWRQFGNGEEFYDVGTPSLVEQAKKDRRWKIAGQVTLGHSDRWDTGPEVGALHGWQDFEGFNEYLLSLKKPGLTGKTREELAKEIHGKYEGEWQAWNCLRYVHDVRTLREAFLKEGKKLLITAQGLTLVPMRYAVELAETIRGSSDDTTWGMWEESVPYTTGRQMAAMAFSPAWAMSTLCQWGYDSGTLGNPQWRGPVGTTEPSRRHLYDRAFRGVIRADGNYTSMHYYGYNSNAGYAYTMNTNDYQQYHRVQELHSLMTPDGPLGVGLVLSTARVETEDNLAIGSPYDSGGRMSDLAAMRNMIWRLHDTGVSIPFTANVATLDKWTGTAPLILINVSHFNNDEIAILKKLHEKGFKITAFMGDGELSADAAELFGVTTAGVPVKGKKIGEIFKKSIISSENTLLIVDSADSMSAQYARAITPFIMDACAPPIKFDKGITGYGFTSNGRKFVVMEDWREEGRTTILHYTPTSINVAKLKAIDVNENTPLNVKKKDNYFEISVPTRPGDGTLVCIEEVK